MHAPSSTRERLAWSAGRLLVGVDEVGRGPLAGPVVAAAVVFAPDAPRVRGVRDSKVLPAPRREVLARRIRARALRLGIGAASARLVDQVNIRIATAIAMRRALGRALGFRVPAGIRLDEYEILLDGLPLPELGLPHQALIDGDALCYSVSAAGVVAKTVRDRLMVSLARRYPGYGWDSNKGYCTEDHLSGLDHLGPTPHHRRSFAPVVQLGLFSPVLLSAE